MTQMDGNSLSLWNRIMMQGKAEIVAVSDAAIVEYNRALNEVMSLKYVRQVDETQFQASVDGAAWYTIPAVSLPSTRRVEIGVSTHPFWKPATTNHIEVDPPKYMQGQICDVDDTPQAAPDELDFPVDPPRVKAFACMEDVKCPGNWEMRFDDHNDEWIFTLPLWNDTLEFRLTFEQVEYFSFNPETIASILAFNAEEQIKAWEERQGKRW